MQILRSLILTIITFSSIFGAVFSHRAAAEDGKVKVLYVTHEPGRYHKYTPQKELFQKIAEKAGWEVTIWTGGHDEQIKKLNTPEYAKGYHAVVYNFCFAHAKDLDAAANVMKQTRELGVPALLIHCSMHSWWDTYKNGKEGALGPDYKGKAKPTPEAVEKWRVAHPKEAFPAWGDFTGIASTRHGPKQPIEMKVVTDHPATKRFPSGFKTGNTELYNNVYQVDGVVSLIEGVQGKSKFSVLWTCPQGKSQVMCLTIGHDVSDWTSEPFQNLVTDGINYLAKHPKP